MDNTSALLFFLRCSKRRSWLRDLLARHASASAAYDAGSAAWSAAGARPEEISALGAANTATIAADLKWLDQSSTHHLIAYGDPAYPALLAQSASPPAALFCSGDPSVLWQPQLAIVGSRNAGAYGQSIAAQMACELARSGLIVTSGLAQGVDAAAHRGALRSGRTIAVIATGPDRCYPKFHQALCAEVAEHGAVISEHFPGTGPRREYFPSRNRIIAGLTLGTLVIEARLRSGALITARLAAEAGREVFAIPGSVRIPTHRGAHQLLRDGAHLVEGPADILPHLQNLGISLGGEIKARLPDSPRPRFENPEQHKIWDLLADETPDFEYLTEQTGLTAEALSSILLTMELEGWVERSLGRFSRKGQFLEAPPTGAGNRK